MAGTLFVVATPIGNLEDVTLRALRVLRDVELIAAEDTRRTARLLAHHGIATPTLSFHAHNTRARIPQLLARLSAAQDIALVTDAGTPGISDPGVELVRACVDAGVAVDPIPGPSAPLVAAIASGFPLDPFTIFGFPPTRSKDRTRWFSEVASVQHTFSFFEAPHRIKDTLTDIAKQLGDRPILVGRELTKVHQEFLRAPKASAIIGRVTNQRGEFTVVVGPGSPVASIQESVPDDRIALEFGQTTQLGGCGRRQAVTALARKYRRSSREVYAIIERAKKLVV